MKVFRSILFKLIAFSTTQCANLSLAGEVKISTVLLQEGEKLQVTLVLEEGLAQHVSLFESLVKEAHATLYKAIKLPFKDSFSVYFNSRPDEHNGQATVVPRDFIRIHTEAPSVYSSIAFSKDYLRETIIHELSHLLVLQQRRAFFQVFSWLVGNASRPIGLWPRWVHEGVAVWVEALYGGRPESGYIDFELRKYAEFYQRKGYHPLENHLLDGSLSLDKVNSGELPYHFGYKIIEAAFPNNEDGRKRFKEFVEDSSGTLGFFFAKKIRQHSRNLNDIFNDEQKSWSATLTPCSTCSNYKVQKSAANILGPFSNEEFLSWVESDGEGHVFLASLGRDEKLERVEWGYPRIVPQQVYRLKDATWLLLGHRYPVHTNESPRNFVFRLHSTGAILCELDLPDRLREIALSRNQLAWIRSTEDGRFWVEDLELRQKGCGKVPVRRQYTSNEAFERLSGLSLSGGNTIFSRSPRRNSFEEELLLEGQKISSEVALSRPQRVPESYCAKAKNCWLAMESSRNHWGPVLIEERSQRWVLKRLPLQTGSNYAAFRDGKLYVQMAYWDKDSIKVVSYEDFQESKIPLRVSFHQAPSPRSESYQKIQSYESYSGLLSLLPRFWLPNMFVYDRGMVVGGSTFFEDITQKWSGSLFAGYDTYPKKPYVYADLNRSSLGMGPFSLLSFQASYLPRVLLGRTQHKTGGKLSFSYRTSLNDSWALGLVPGVEYMRASASHGLRAYDYVIPVLSFSLNSSRAKNDRLPMFRLSDVENSFQFQARFRRLSTYDTYERVLLQSDLPWNVGLQLDAEHGLTDLRNFPASYFELGGQADFETREGSFLTRGFPVRFFLAKEALRVGAQLGFKLVKRIGSLSWNRFRLEDWEQRFIFETVSWDSFSESSRFRTGRQYFTSVGAEWNFYGQLLHYAGFNSSFAVFKGLGDYGEWRFNWTLGTALDVP